MGQAKLKKVIKPVELKLDLGCGKNKREGFIGVDCRKFEGVDIVCNLTERFIVPQSGLKHSPERGPYIEADFGKFKPWPWDDGSVAEVHCSHFVEHLTASERIHFVNELYRVLKVDGIATLITPHWASCRAYGDLTHQWPPVSEFWLYYLAKKWRMENAPHNDEYTCDFEATWGYGMREDLVVRNQEYQQFAMQNYKEACTDLHVTLKKH